MNMAGRESGEEEEPFISKIKHIAEIQDGPPCPPSRRTSRNSYWQLCSKAFDAAARLTADLPTTFPSVIPRVLMFVVPSFWQPRDTQPRDPPRPTAYLDSVRGVAAFLIVVHHYTYIAWKTGEGYLGSDDPEKNHYIFQLPFIRLLHTGPPMVAIFFVISGYVLSIQAAESHARVWWQRS